ncbi:MAG: S9 family peptidase, partial [Gemmatimonadota bacterium]
MRRAAASLFAAALVFSTLPAYAATRSATRTLSLDDHARIRTLDDLQVSPDGRRAVLNIGFVDTKKDEYTSDLWLLDLKTGLRLRLTTHPGEESHPRFSPDGGRLAFLADRDGRTRIHVLPFVGGESTVLFKFDEEIEAFEWFPDGARIAFIAKEPKKKPGGAKADGGGAKSTGAGAAAVATAAAEKTKKEEKAAEKKKIRIITRKSFKSDGEGYLDGRYTHLWVYEAESGRIRQLTEGRFDHSDPAVSPDGKMIAFVSNRTDDADMNLDSDIYAMRSRGGEIIRVSVAPGSASRPAWSPDGSELAYLEQTLPNMYGANNYLWVAPMQGGTVLPSFGDPRNLTEDLDRGVGPGSYSTEEGRYPIWSPDGRYLYVVIEDRARMHAYAVARRTGARSLLIGGERLVEFLTPTQDGERLVFGIADPSFPGVVFSAAADGSDERRLTHLNADWLEQVKFNPAERFSFNSFDGWEIEGFVIKPPTFRRNRPFPAVLVIHGGPSWYYPAAWSYFRQYLASRGYLVIFPNPRGSTSYGEVFTSSVLGRYGLEDFKDMLGALDTIAALGWVDEKNQFVTGYSYGGMMTDWAITQTDRFRAAASGAGIADYAGATGMDDSYLMWIAEFGGAPWEVP